MATVCEQRTYTPDELLKLPKEQRGELVNGRLVEKDRGYLECRVAMLIGGLLAAFVEDNKRGSTFNSELHYRCFPFAPELVRKPDVSFIRLDRLQASMFGQGLATIAPDLAVEVVSPRDPYREVEGKVDEYLRAGVRLVWVINPERELVRIHRADGSVSEVRGAGELSGEDVLPGFSTPVARLFQLPPNLQQA